LVITNSYALDQIYIRTGVAGVPVIIRFVIDGTGVDTAMRLLFVPLVGLLVVTVLA